MCMGGYTHVLIAISSRCPHGMASEGDRLCQEEVEPEIADNYDVHTIDSSGGECVNQGSGRLIHQRLAVQGLTIATGCVQTGAVANRYIRDWQSRG